MGTISQPYCLSGSCRYTKPVGQHVNGPCRCDQCPLCGANIRPTHGQHYEWCENKSWKAPWQNGAMDDTIRRMVREKYGHLTTGFGDIFQFKVFSTLHYQISKKEIYFEGIRRPSWISALVRRLQ